MDTARRWLKLGPASFLLIFLLIPGACQPGDRSDAGTETAGADTAMAVQREMPVDTTAEAVWAYLQAQDYRDSWDFWPGREPYYEGTEPHGALLSTYLNAPAMRGLTALRNQESVDDLPFGSMLVKENYNPDSTLASITVMYKAEGFDPEHHDWWWMRRFPDGTVQASGRGEMCLSCHQQASASADYLMTQFSEMSAGGGS